MGEKQEYKNIVNEIRKNKRIELIAKYKRTNLPAVFANVYRNIEKGYFKLVEEFIKECNEL